MHGLFAPTIRGIEIVEMVVVAVMLARQLRLSWTPYVALATGVEIRLQVLGDLSK